MSAGAALALLVGGANLAAVVPALSFRPQPVVVPWLPPTSGGLDVNGDGQIDFSFSIMTYSTLDVPSSGSSTFISIQGNAGSQILNGLGETVFGKETRHPVSFQAGEWVPLRDTLGPALGYRDGVGSLATVGRSHSTYSIWWRFGDEVTDAFIPFTLATAEGDLYGYFHFSLVHDYVFDYGDPETGGLGSITFPTLLLHGWGLADAPEQSLVMVPIPEPGMAALLALGAAVLAARRQRGRD